MNDQEDYEKERMNPYYGICPKHGAWQGSYDECSKCMEEEYKNEQDSIPNSICWYCCFGDEPSTFIRCKFNPKLKLLRQKPRKKKCKHYQFNRGDYA